MPAILVRPSAVQVGRSANQSLTLTLAGGSWTGGTTFTLSGVAGIVLVRTIVNAAGSAKLVITTAAASGTHTLTVSDGTNSGTTVVKPVASNRRKWFAGLGRPEDLVGPLSVVRGQLLKEEESHK